MMARVLVKLGWLLGFSDPMSGDEGKNASWGRLPTFERADLSKTLLGRQLTIQRVTLARRVYAYFETLGQNPKHGVARLALFEQRPIELTYRYDQMAIALTVVVCLHDIGQSLVLILFGHFLHLFLS